MPISPLKNTRRSSGIISPIGGSISREHTPSSFASKDFLAFRSRGRERFTQAKPKSLAPFKRDTVIEKADPNAVPVDFSMSAHLRAQQRQRVFEQEGVTGLEQAKPEDLPDNVFEHLSQGFKRGWHSTVEPARGYLMEVLGDVIDDPVMIGRGKRITDEILADFAKRPELKKPENIKGFLEGGLKDPDAWAQFIGEQASIMASVMGISIATGGTGGYVLMGGIEGAQLNDELIKMGVEEDKARFASGIYGTIASIIENKLGFKPTQGLGAFRSLVIKEIPKLALEGAAQEASQQWLENLTKKFFNEDQKLMEGLAEAAVSGLIGETLFGTTVSSIGTVAESEAVKKATQSQEGFARIPFVAGESGTLEQEARKYKTAEEFVGAQDILYHGTDATFDEFSLESFGQTDEGFLGRGIYLTSDKTFAEEFGSNIKEIYADIKNPLVIDDAFAFGGVNPDKIRIELGLPKSATPSQVRSKLIKDGYDGVIVNEITDDGLNKAIEVVALNTDQIKTKEQLTEIFNQSQQPQTTEADAKLVEDVRETRQPVEVTAKDVAPVRSPIIETAKRETTLLKEKLRTLSRGAKIGAVETKRQIKENQTYLTNVVRKLPLEAKDKAKFISSIKEATTVAKLANEINKIETKSLELQQSAIKRDLIKAINKELKSSKALKTGKKRVGRYDYETNKFFDRLREYNVLNQEQAQVKLDSMPLEEGMSNMDKIETRFLSYKTNGMKSSVSLVDRVLGDIQEMKEVGKDSKDDADFEIRIEEEKKVNTVHKGIQQQKAGRSPLTKKALKMYQRGFTNQYSLINSIAGKEVSSQFSPEVVEDNRDSAAFVLAKQASIEAAEILGLESEIQLGSTLHDLSNKTDKGIQMTDKGGITRSYSKLEIIDIYNSVKNDLLEKRYHELFGKDEVNELLSSLSSVERQLGDMMQRYVQNEREIFNKWSIENTGRDLGTIENYWMTSSEQAIDTVDGMRIQGEIPSSVKERSKSGKLVPIPKNAWNKMSKHLAQAKHVEYVSRYYAEVKRIFSDRKVKAEIESKFGEDIYRDLMGHINLMSLNKVTEQIDAISGAYDRLLNNWVKAKIFSPTVLARQLGSMVNYAEDMNTGTYLKFMSEGVVAPKKTFDYMWKNAPWLEARFNRGYSEALEDAMKDSDSFNLKTDVFTKYVTLGVRTGDVAAIIYGGYPMVKAAMDGGMSKKEAFKLFHEKTLRSQQASVKSSRSLYQNITNPLAKTFLRFKNTLNQYTRKQGDAIIDYANKDISAKQFAKITSIYSIINPALYVMLGYWVTQGFKGLFGKEDEDKDIWSDIMEQMAVHAFQVVPFLDSLSRYVYRRVMDKPTYGQIFSQPLTSDIETAFKKVTKKNVTFEDWFRFASIVQEPLTGLPTEVVGRYFRYATEGGGAAAPAGTSSGIQIKIKPIQAPQIRVNPVRAPQIRLNR